jgi:hypothetical protein
MKLADETLMKLSPCWLLAIFLLWGCGKPMVEPTQVVEPTPAATNVIGTVIEFGDGGASGLYRRSGWAETSRRLSFTWTEGKSAKLVLPIPANSGPLTLKMRMGGLIHPPDLLFQPVEVYANGQKIADLQVSKLADFEASIPASIPNPDGKIEIEFRIPKSVSPKALGESSDSRELGIYVVRIQPIT